MGSTLGPPLANIFVGFHEGRLLCISLRLLLYYWYLDDTVFLFNDADQFLYFLNSFHPASRFTVEKESNSQLIFLGLLVHRT